MNAKPSRSGSRRQASSRSRARTSIRPGFLDISDDEQIQDSESSSQAVEGDSQASLPNTTPLNHSNPSLNSGIGGMFSRFRNEETMPTNTPVSDECDELPDIEEQFIDRVEENSEDIRGLDSNRVENGSQINVSMSSESVQDSQTFRYPNSTSVRTYFKTYSRIEGTHITHDTAVLEACLEFMTRTQKRKKDINMTQVSRDI